MRNPELLARLKQLSPDEKAEIVEFLTAELLKERGLKSLENSAVYRTWSPYNYDDAAEKMMSLLEEEQGK